MIPFGSVLTENERFLDMCGFLGCLGYAFFSVSPYWGCRILMGSYSYTYCFHWSFLAGYHPLFWLWIMSYKPVSLIRLLLLRLLYVFQFFTRFKVFVLGCKPLFLHLMTIFERTWWILSLFSKFSLSFIYPFFTWLC